MRGSILDMFVVLIMILIFGICDFVGYHVLNNFNAQSTGMLVNTEGLEMGLATMGYLDPVIVFATFGLGVAVMPNSFPQRGRIRNLAWPGGLLSASHSRDAPVCGRHYTGDGDEAQVKSGHAGL